MMKWQVNLFLDSEYSEEVLDAEVLSGLCHTLMSLKIDSVYIPRYTWKDFYVHFNGGATLVRGYLLRIAS